MFRLKMGKIGEVYRLNNWDFLRDAFATNPKNTARENIIRALKKTREVHPYNRDAIDTIIETCSLAITQDGFEECINLNREDLSPSFVGPGISPKFEEFLENLDKIAGEWREDAKKHIL